MSKVKVNAPCPCGTTRKFKKCCLPIIQGRLAPSPSALMRSRYSAYATGFTSYIIETTDPEGPQFEGDLGAWSESIREFGSSFKFEGVEIESAGELDDGSQWVRFKALLTGKGGGDASFVETSRFIVADERWLYHGPIS